MRTILTLMLVSFVGVATFGQGARPQSFDVASVKRNTVVGQAGRIADVHPSGFTAVNMSLRDLILWAFEIRGYQLLDAPGWATTTRFDVLATYPEHADPQAYARVMLQQLLGERFQMVARRETREVQGFLLVTARSDKRLGPQLTRSDVDCVKWLAEGKPQMGAGGKSPVAPGGARPACMMLGRDGLISGGTRTMAMLATNLADRVTQPVVDRTELTGAFDIDMRWAPSVEARGAAVPKDDDAPSIFTALEEQLGLRLQPGRVPLDALVVQSVQMPTEN